jgi:hypothetical protein
MKEKDMIIMGLEWVLKDNKFGFGDGTAKPTTPELQAGAYIRNAIIYLKKKKTTKQEAKK